MFLKKHEKRRLSPWCVIIIGGLATVGAMSIVSACRDTVMEKGRAIASMFKKGKGGCACPESSSD